MSLNSTHNETQIVWGSNPWIIQL